MASSAALASAPARLIVRGIGTAATPVAVVGVAAGVVVVVSGVCEVWAAGVTVWMLIVSSSADLATRRVPTQVVHTAAWTSAVLIGLQTVVIGDGQALVRCAVCVVAAGAVFGGLWAGAPQYIGLGDVRLLVATLPVAAFISWAAAVGVLQSAFAAAAAMLALARWRSLRDVEASIPFAPALAVGFVVTVAVT